MAVGVPVLTETADIANVRLELEDGLVANLTASRVSRERMRKFRIFQSDAYFAIDFAARRAEVIIRRPGAVPRPRAPPPAGPEALARLLGGLEHSEIDASADPEPLAAEIAAFVAHVRDGRRRARAARTGGRRWRSPRRWRARWRRRWRERSGRRGRRGAGQSARRRPRDDRGARAGDSLVGGRPLGGSTCGARRGGDPAPAARGALVRARRPGDGSRGRRASRASRRGGGRRAYEVLGHLGAIARVRSRLARALAGEAARRRAPISSFPSTIPA